jgi:hypothetical protein
VIQQSVFRNLFRIVFWMLAVASSLPAAAAVTAAPKNKLQSLVSDTATQIQLAYRQHPAESQRRQAQLAAVVASWRTAAQSEANNERLATWLRAAIASSMPGSTDPLPPAPTFIANAKNETRPAETSVLMKAAATPSENSDTDPFRDDPE